MISLTNRAKQLGPFLKLVICICVLPVLLISYPVVGIIGSIVGGAAYGYLSPIFATFEAVEEGKDDKLFHCFVVCFIFLLLLKCSLFLFCYPVVIRYRSFILHPQDGTWSTIERSCMVVRDVRDVCFHSYFSVMDDLRQKGPPDSKYYEIRYCHWKPSVCLFIFMLSCIYSIPWNLVYLYPSKFFVLDNKLAGSIFLVLWPM